MKTRCGKGLSPRGIALVSAGFNLALAAACNPAMAHGGEGGPSHSGAMWQGPVGAAYSSGISAHFGATTPQGLVHPHVGPTQPLAGSFSLLSGGGLVHPTSTTSAFMHPTAAASLAVQNLQGISSTISPTAITGAMELDLGSSAKSIVVQAGVITHGSSATIDVGGVREKFQTGSAVTPAELVAIYQEQNGGQKLVLNKEGQADGGSFSLNSLLAAGAPVQASGIVVPAKVTALDFISANTNLSLSGDLLNYGSIVDVTKGSPNLSANLSALDIINESGGLITSTGHGAGSGSVDLGLNAAKDFTNLGSISSSGALSITAGGTLTNIGTSGSTGSAGSSLNPGGSLIAVNAVSLQAPGIVNSGLVQSNKGDITLGAGGPLDLTINNAGGTLRALNGAIDVRDAAYNGAGNTELTGGNLFSQQVNLNAGAGTVNVNVDQLTGTVNSNGNAVHVQASTPELVLGAQNLSGDPTYYNSAGSIQLTGTINVTQQLAIIASGNITCTSGNLNISAQTLGGVGQNITIIAGANVTSTGGGGDTTSTIPGTTATSSVQLTGVSSTGGNVDFSNASPFSSINTSGTGANASGNLTIAAFAENSGTGSILLTGNTTIISQQGTGTAGNITLIAGNNTGGTAINLGNVQAGGNLQLLNFQPIITSGPLKFATDGSISAGQIGPDYTNPGNGDIVIHGGGIDNVNNITINAGGVFTAFFGADVIGSGSVVITAPGTISIGGNIIGVNGITLVSGHDIVTTTASEEILTGDAPIPGGNITITAGVAFSVSASGPAVTTTPSLTGGKIDFNTTPLGILSSNDGESSGAGNITLTAYAGSDNSGSIALPTANPVEFSGNPNGNFTAIAGQVGGTAISVGPLFGIAGFGGTIQLTSTGAGATITAGQISLNGGTVNINSNGNVQLGASGISIGSGSFTLVEQGSSALTLGSTSGPNYVNTIFAQGSPTGNISISNIDTLGTGNGGIVVPNLKTPFQLGFNAGGNITLIAGSAPGDVINFGTATTLNASSSLSLANSISLQGYSITWTGQGSTPLQLSATNTGGGQGSITIETAQTSQLVIGSGQLELTTAGGTIGGNITVQNNGSISVNPLLATIAPAGGGTGGTLSLSAGYFQNQQITTGSANLLAIGNIDLSSAPASNLIIQTVGSTDFTIGLASGVNGIMGTILGGSAAPNVNIQNNALGCGIVVNTAVSGLGQAVLASGPNAGITFSAPFSAAQVDLTAGLGGVTSSKNNDIVQATTLDISSKGEIGSGTPLYIQSGTVALTNSSSPSVNLFNETSGTISMTGSASFFIAGSAAGQDITLSGPITSTNYILVLSGGNIVLANSQLQTGIGNGITLIAAENVGTSGAGSSLSTVTTGLAGPITVVAGAQFSQISSEVSITGASGTGGNVDLSTGGQLASFSAQGTNTGSGGTITLTAFAGSNNPGAIVLPAGLTVTAGAGNSSVGNAGNFFAVSGLANGTAINIGNVSLAATAPTTAASGGQIWLQSTTPAISAGSPFILLLSGQTIEGSPLSGSIAPNNSSIVAGNLTAPSGNGVVGAIHVNSSDNLQLGTLSAVGGLDGTNAGNVIITALGSSTLTVGASSGANYIGTVNISPNAIGGNAGSVNITNADPNNVGSLGITLGSLPFNLGTASGGSISLTAGSAAGDVIDFGLNNQLSVSDGSAGSATAAGSIYLSANGLTWTNSAIAALLLQANAFNSSAPSRMGGIITLQISGSSPLNITGNGSAQIQLSAQGAATGAGGIVTIENGGSITLDPVLGLNISPGVGGGSGGNLNVYAGYLAGIPIANANASLLVTGPLNANATVTGTGGNILLASNTTTDFNVGLVTGNTNGVQGTSAVSGAGGGINGSITLLNAAGSVVTSTDITAVTNATLTAGGNGSITIGGLLGSVASATTVNLTAAGSGTISQVSPANVVAGASVNLTSSGDIGSATGPFAVNTAALTIGASGSVYLSDASTVNLQIANGSTLSTFVLSTAGGANITTSSNITAGQITLVSGGNLNLGGNLVAPGGMVLVASGDIIETTSNITLSTASTVGNGGAMTLIAGANFSLNNSQVTVTGASATGGQINILSSDTGGNITSVSSLSTGNGGNITLVAFAGSNNTGNITLPSSEIVETFGGGALGTTNGNFTAVSGVVSSAVSGTAINIGSVSTTNNGASQPGGIITLQTATPAVNNTTPLVVNYDGSIASGNPVASSTGGTSGDIAAMSLSAQGGTVNIESSGSIIALQGAAASSVTLATGPGGDIGNPNNQLGLSAATLSITSGGNVFINDSFAGTVVLNAATAGSAGAFDFTTAAGSDLSVQAPVSGNSVALVSGSNLILGSGASITAPGGITLVASENISTSVSGLSINSSNASGNAGDIAIIAGASYTVSNTGVTVNGASTTGGKIDFASSAITSLTSESTVSGGSTGNGGSITLLAFTGSDLTGTINLPTAKTVLTDGNGVTGATNGNFTAVAGHMGTVLPAISIGAVTTTQNSNFNGGTITLQAAAPQVSGPLVASFTGAVSGDPTSASGFNAANIAAGNLTAHAGSVNIDTGANVQIGNIDANAFSTTLLTGGSVTIQTSGATQLVVGFTGVTPPANYVGIVSAGSTFSTGMNGNISISNLDPLNAGNGGILVNPGGISNSGSNNGLGGGGLALIAGSAVGDTINLGGLTTLNYSGGTQGGAAGIITLTGNNVTWTTTGSTPLVLSANASTKAGSNLGGGDITFETANTASLNLSATGVMISATGTGSGQGGFVTIENGGNITLNPTSTSFNIAAGLAGGSGGGLVVKAGYFNDLPIGAGTASLLVTGSLSVNGNGAGNGGSIQLGSNSATVFNVGLTKANTNGVEGALSVTGSNGGANGLIDLFNANGGITTTAAMAAVNEVLFIAGGSGSITLGGALGSPGANGTTGISLTAAESIIESSSKSVISVGTTGGLTLMGGTTGSIGGKTVFLVNAPTMSVTGGIVNISDSATSVNLGASGSGTAGSFIFKAAGPLTVANITAGTGITLTAPSETITGSLSASSAASIVTVTASTGDIGGSTSTDISGGASVTLTAAKGTVSFGTIGNVTIPGKVTITDLGAINGNTGVSAVNAITIKTTSTKSGDIDIPQIIASSGTSVVAVTSAAGSINASGVVTGGKSVTLTASKGSISLGGVGNGTVNPGALVLTALNNISADGTVTAVNSITAKTTATTAGNGLINLGGTSATNVQATSKTGVVTLTASGITTGATDALSVGPVLASKSVALTAAKGPISVASIGSVAQPSGTIAITAANGITASADLNAVTSVAVKTTAATGTNGGIALDGNVLAFSAAAPTKGTVTITSTGVGPTGITSAAGTDISAGTSVTVTAAKGTINLQSGVGTAEAPAKVVVSGLDGVSLAAVDATTSITVTATAKTGGTGIMDNGNIFASGLAGTVAMTATGSNIVDNADISAGKSVVVSAPLGSVTVGTTGANNIGKTGTVAITALNNITDSGLIEAVTNVSLSTKATTAADGININGGITTTGGPISVISAGGFLDVGASGTPNITAQSSSAKVKATVLLEDSNLTKGTMSLSNATVATAGAGGNNITVTIGKAPTSPVAGSPPSGGNVSVTGSSGTVFWGAAGVVDPNASGSVTLAGANLIFASPSTAGKITFSNTFFNPDPPTTGASALALAVQTQLTNPGLSSVGAASIGAASIGTLAVAPTAAGLELMPAINFTATPNGIVVSPLQASPGLQSPANTAAEDFVTTTGGAVQGSLSGISGLAVESQQTTNLQGSAEIFAPAAGAYNWISATEIDGGEIPVSLMSDLPLAIRAADAAELETLAPADGGSKVKVAKLARGSVLAVPAVDTIIKTSHGDVSMAAGSLVLVMALPNGLAVYNFDDKHKDAVSITADGKHLVVRPGSSAVIVSGDSETFADINPAQLVAYRHMMAQSLDGEMTAYRAEFSMLSAMEAVKPLKAMMLSSHRETRRLGEHLLKTTAILMQLQSSGEHFRQILRPQLTAWR